MNKESSNGQANASTQLITRPTMQETAHIAGRYSMKHIRNGKVLHEEMFDNVVTNEGAHFMLDSILQTAYTPIVGPFMGIISAGTPTASSTMATPIFTEATSGMIAARLTTVGNWNAAGTPTAKHKQLTAAITFTCGGTGFTATGCFLVLGPSAVATSGSTAGKLFSAGLFGSSRTLITGDQIQVSYDTNL